MVLDVEGHELEVLKGMNGAPSLPAILVVEHGQLGLPVISRALEPMGYRFDYESFVNSVWILDRNKNRSDG